MDGESSYFDAIELRERAARLLSEAADAMEHAANLYMQAAEALAFLDLDETLSGD